LSFSFCIEFFVSRTTLVLALRFCVYFIVVEGQIFASLFRNNGGQIHQDHPKKMGYTKISSPPPNKAVPFQTVGGSSRRFSSSLGRRDETAPSTTKTSTMVKVWYNPPPYGPRTALNRPAYGTGNDIGPKWVVRISKMPPARVITGFLAAFVGIAYIPLSKCLAV
jgi:hypothetical protein